MSEQIEADAGSQGAKPAGFWIRFAAYIIDAILITIVGWLIAAVFGIGGVMNMDMSDPEAMSDAVSGALMGLQVGIMVLWLIYFAAFESSKLQATPGKLVVGVRVSDAAGARIGIGRALGRALAKFVSAIILMIGFIMAAFTDRKRALHDMMAGTLVSYR